MKKLFIAVILLVAGTAHAQKPNVKIDNAGNYVALSRSVAKDTATGRFYIGNDDVLWPVYRTPRGKLYALRVSAKTGKTYKYYLKPDTDTLDWEGN
jgi:hypothetical protein